MAERSKRRLVTLSAATGALIEREAAERGMSQSVVMAELIRDGLDFSDRCAEQRAASALLDGWREWALKPGVYR